MIKIGIDALHYPISSKPSSHRAGWAMYWRHVLQKCYPQDHVEILHRGDEDRWPEFDKLFFYHGIEWSGGLNLPGGMSPEILSRFERFAELQVELYSLDIPFPDFYSLLLKRDVDLPGLKDLPLRACTVELPRSKSVVLGDSHALGVMASHGEYVKVNRIDFKTLHGALSMGLANLINDPAVTRATVFFGMIDVRHHVRRYPIEQTQQLLAEFETQLKSLNMDIELAELYPMTKDTRRLPKTGYYKGTPFYGSLEDRIKIVDWWNQQLQVMRDRNSWRIYTPPAEFKDEDGTMDEAFMEKPQSVHLSPAHYRYDFDNDRVRY